MTRPNHSVEPTPRVTARVRSIIGTGVIPVIPVMSMDVDVRLC